jgi:phosphatidylinositol alpha-1,6-mannosyltransferase
MDGSAPLPARPLRLAFVSHVLHGSDGRPCGVGGAQRAAAELLAAYRSRADVEVTPLLADPPGDGGGVGAFALGSLLRLRRLAGAGRIDAVLFSAMPTAWMAWLLRGAFDRAGVAAAAVCHGHDLTFRLPAYQWLVPRMLASLDAAFPISEATAAQAFARGLDPRRAVVTANGVDGRRFAPPPQPQDRRAILAGAFPAEAAALEPESVVICSVGRQVRRKGHAWFVRQVLPRLPATVHLWLAGDGPEARAIEAAAASAGASGRVRRLGLLSEARLQALYRGADLFVMPNIPEPGDMEGFGLVLLEANLNGLPVVAAALEGVAEVIVDGVSGRLAPAGDGAAFAEAVGRLIQDRRLRWRLGLQGHDYARARFSWAATAERQLAALAALARTPAQGPARAWRPAPRPDVKLSSESVI